MAKFLNTRKAVSEIEDLIRNAESKLILISPYLKLSKDFKEDKKKIFKNIEILNWNGGFFRKDIGHKVIKQ